MKSCLVVVVFLLFLASCGRKDGMPSGILPQKKMQAIIWDMMRADQFLTDYVLNKDASLSKNDESLKYYLQIFAIHQISQKEFQKSFYYYKSHPSLFKAIMDSLSQVSGEAPTQMVNPPVSIDTVSNRKIRPLPVDTAFRLKRIKQID